MILQQLINLKPGQHFADRGHKCTVIWTEHEDEEVGIFDDKMVYSRHRAICYQSEVQTSPITLRSMWPHPDKLELPDYNKI